MSQRKEKEKKVGKEQKLASEKEAEKVGAQIDRKCAERER